jgi:HAD superfamily hydrolase (TIGR01549 family)
MIEAVLFDVDGVLMDSLEANTHFFGKLFTHFGYEAPTKAEYKKIYNLSIRDVIRVWAKVESEEQIEKMWEYSRTLPYDLGLLSQPEDAPKVIADLAKRYRLGIVTSRGVLGLEKYFDFSGLKIFFEASVVYEETEKHKPDPEPINLILEKMKLTPSSAVYIGDSATDVEACQSIGMRCISFNNQESLPEATAHAENFSDLPNIIKSLDF